MPDLARWPTGAALRWLTAAALAASVVLFTVFALRERPLRPYSIVAFELAATPAQAAAILDVWGPGGRQLARESLLLDFAFMPAYALLFAGLLLLEARRSGGGLQRLGLRLVVAPFLAWLLDALENAALLGVLAAPAAPLTVTAAVSAYAKFALLMACGLYVIFTLAYRLALWLGRRGR